MKSFDTGKLANEPAARSGTQLVRDLIRDRQDDFTAAERRVTAVLQDGSLVAGLQSITRLAEAAEVSTPTVIRLARKLGFDGFTELQEAIRTEVAARMKAPLAKLDEPPPAARADHIVSRFAIAAQTNLNATIDRLDADAFDRIATLIADPGRDIHVLGGRITRSNAHYLFNHLQIIRPGVSLLDNSPSVWPQALLDIGPRSVLVLFDIRRYEKDLDRLAGFARAQGARLALFTDQWGSPIERHADATFRCMVEAPSAWDSTLAMSFLVEALVAEVQAQSADTARRIEALETMIGASRIFRGG